MTDETTSAVRIPPYNPMDPSLWLHMLEATFELATPKPITASKTKFNYAISNLPPDVAAIIRDVIINPSSEQPFETLRAAILSRCGETRSQEIRRLLAGEQLGDRKPSELLRVMQRRAENNNIEDSLLLELFLQQMPLNVQTVLASILPVPIGKAAEVADRILEVASPQTSACSTSSTHSELLKEVKELRREVDNLRRTRSHSRYRQHRSPSRHRHRSPSPAVSGICWYHRKFESAAKKCIPPCVFSENHPQQR